jgi:hypothetical protein
MKRIVFAGIIGLLVGVAGALIAWRVVLGNQKRLIPTDNVEQLLTAPEIRSQFGIDVREGGGRAKGYQLIGSGEFVTVASCRIPYYIYNELGGGGSVAFQDWNSPSPKGTFFVYDHRRFRTNFGVRIPGVKFNALRQYSASP